MNKTYDKIFVGGGIASLMAAYQTKRMAVDAGVEYDILVLAESIHPPTAVGSHITLALDGLGKLPSEGKDTMRVLMLDAMHELCAIVDREKIACGLRKGYQFLGRNAEEARQLVDLIIRDFNYKEDYFREVPQDDVFRLSGFTHAWETDLIGQINAHDLLWGIQRAITELGGDVVVGRYYRYYRHHTARGKTELYTSYNREMFESRNVPLMATGAHHIQYMSKMRGQTYPEYTIAAHARLNPEHAQAISRRPIAGIDSQFAGDVLWATLDPKNIFTAGIGYTSTPRGERKLIRGVRSIFREVLPDIADLYEDKLEFSFGAMTMTHNGMPIIGRMTSYDVSTGFGSGGLVAATMAGKAWANSLVQGNHETLETLEALQPQLFERSRRARRQAPGVT